jgi:hypothetical protein
MNKKRGLKTDMEVHNPTIDLEAISEKYQRAYKRFAGDYEEAEEGRIRAEK